MAEINIGNSADFPEGQGRRVMIEGKPYAVFRHGGALGCIENLCPHSGGALADGAMGADGRIICPLHQRRFHFQTGLGVDDEHVSGFRIREEAGVVYVDVSQPLGKSATLNLDDLLAI